MNLQEIISYLVALAKNYQSCLRWLSLGSLVALLVTPLLIVMIVISLPADYFANPQRRQAKVISRYPAASFLFLFLKNLVGFLLLLTGFILLFMPGQGFLTILVGLMLINFPGKYRVQRLVLSKPKVRTSLNKLRRRFNQPPLYL